MQKERSGSRWSPTSGAWTGLSYEEVGSWARKEPLPATPIMADSGGGWIVTRWVFEDRARV